jgi:hypothetical protein
MRLDIYGLFVVRVLAPAGGWAKGRHVVFIEEGDALRPTDLLIPNDLTERQLERYVAWKFSAFARPGEEIRRLDPECLAA